MEIYSRSEPTAEPALEARLQPSQVRPGQLGRHHEVRVLRHPHAAAGQALQQAAAHLGAAASAGYGQELIPA